MSFRHVELALMMGLGSLSGWYVASPLFVFVGSLVGALVWVSLDAWRLTRVMQWLRSDDGANAPRLPHVWGLLVDKTLKIQKKLSAKVRESQSRLDEFLSAIQASPNGVLLLDSQGRIEWSNLTAADHLGIDPQRDLRQHITNLVRDPHFLAYLGAGEFQSEVTITGPCATPAKPVVVAIRIHPYGQKRRLMLSRDVTAVQQAEAMRRDFVANVSHEIRTPLTVLSGFVETLQTLNLSEQDRTQYLGLMATQAQRMQSLVSDLLMLSRLEGSPTPNRQTWVRASVLLVGCMDEAKALSNLVATPPHVFGVDIATDFDLAGSETELTSALSNLLNNAVRYTPSGRHISVGLRVADGGDAEIWVSDTGPGIAPEHMHRLTERFYRVDRSRSRDTGGTGLGLAIVKHVAQRHGGNICITSRLGEGSVFTLRFPANRVTPVRSNVSV